MTTHSRRRIFDRQCGYVLESSHQIAHLDEWNFCNSARHAAEHKVAFVAAVSSPAKLPAISAAFLLFGGHRGDGALGMCSRRTRFSSMRFLVRFFARSLAHSLGPVLSALFSWLADRRHARIGEIRTSRCVMARGRLGLCVSVHPVLPVARRTARLSRA
jgi:hypothetical protein